MSYYFREVINFMGQVNNVVQFLITLLSLGTILIVIFFKSYRKILFDLFRSSGIHNTTVFKILWVCRKNAFVRIRHFCEFAIIRSEGNFLSNIAWDQMIHDFTNTAGDKHGLISIDNALVLQKDEVIKLIDKYFAFFGAAKNRKKFKIYDNMHCFLSRIEILDGYVSPITRIRGLQERFCDDWKMIIDSYSHFRKVGNSPSDELYMFYTWLMWGPSVYLPDIDDNYKLVTYGYGDEANSLNAVLKISAESDMLWSQLKLNLNSCHRSGMICKIFPASRYFNLHRSMFSYSTMPFIDVLIEGNESGIIAEIESINHNNELFNGYFSAYIWIMFIRDDGKRYEPNKSVVFFEHANIADIESYQFFKRALIDEVRYLSHIELGP